MPEPLAIMVHQHGVRECPLGWADVTAGAFADTATVVSTSTEPVIAIRLPNGIELDEHAS